MNRPSVFISYSWDSDSHSKWVDILAGKLQSDDIDVVLDQWELALGDKLPEFMETQIYKCDFVLIICTPNYKIRFDDRQGGVGYERGVILNAYHSNRNDRKFIPILASGTWDESAPYWVTSKSYLDLSTPESFTRKYSELIETVHSRRKTGPPVRTRSTYDHAIQFLSATYANGQPNLQERLFAIQMLEQIIVGADRHYYVPAIEHLCAYVRQEAPASGLNEFPGTQLRRFQGVLGIGDNLFDTHARDRLAALDSADALRLDIDAFESQVKSFRKASWYLGSNENATSQSEERRFQEFHQWLAGLPRPREDIRAAVNAVSRRPKKAGAVLEREASFQIDLSRCNLRHIRLEGPQPNLDHVTMSKSYLEGFDANGCSATGANFSRSNMEGAKFSGTNCSNASFDRTAFELTSFRNADLSHASFARSMLSTTEFDHANLRDANFSDAYLNNVLFWHSKDANLHFVSEVFADCDLRFAQTIQGLPSNHSLEVSSASITSYALVPDEGREWTLRFCFLDGKGRQYDWNSYRCGKLNAFGSSFRNCVFLGQEWEMVDFSDAFGDASVVFPKDVQRPQKWDNTVLNDTAFFLQWRTWLREIGHEREFGDQVPEEFRGVGLV